MPALTGRIPARPYRDALRTGGAWAFYLAAAPARIGVAMTGLGIVWLVHGATGSYAAAGTVTGVFAVSEALAGPQGGRLADRYGQTRVVPLGLLVHVAAVATLIGLCIGDASLWSLVAAGALAGGSVPQIGALTAARWSAALRGDPLLSSAFALESLGTAVAFLVGPALVGTVSSLVSPVAGLALATGLLAGGGIALVLQRRTAPPPVTRGQRHDAGRLLRPAFLALVGASIGIGLFFGTMQVSVTAFAVGHDAAGLAGPLYSVTSLVSLLAGLAYGARRWRMSPARQLVLTCALLTMSCLPLLLVRGPGTLAVALALPGVLLAPYLVLVSVLAESWVPDGVITQAFTWLGSGSAAGIAAGAAVSGRVVNGNDPRWGFALAIGATLLVLCCAVLAAVRRRDL